MGKAAQRDRQVSQVAGFARKFDGPTKESDEQLFVIGEFAKPAFMPNAPARHVSSPMSRAI